MWLLLPLSLIYSYYLKTHARDGATGEGIPYPLYWVTHLPITILVCGGSWYLSLHRHASSVIESCDHQLDQS